jgi:uridine kinase
MSIIDVRGTHGSGKSWVMHTLLKSSKHHPLLDERGVHLGLAK